MVTRLGYRYIIHMRRRDHFLVAGDGEYRVVEGVVCGQVKCGTVAAYTRIKMQDEETEAEGEGTERAQRYERANSER